MVNAPKTRLEAALELYLDHQRSGGSWPELLAAHADVADLLEAFRDESPDPAAGAAVTIGEFRIEHEIGRGGVGIVYAAVQPRLGRRVALKVLHAGFAVDPTALRRFRREALTLARLDHAGIIRVLDVGEDRGQHWLAMECIDGESMAQHLDQLRAHGGHRGDSRRRLVEHVADVAQALHYAHAAAVVHRDVKPSNILLRGDGRAVLGDFGLARDAREASMTRTGVVAGTPHYMSPEQLAGGGDDSDARSDVYSLGATLYECLTLRRPFEAATTDGVLHQILTEDARDPRHWQRGLPAELAAIALKALEREPERRYATAQAFADDLRAFLELRAVQARPPSGVRRSMRWLRREPLRAAVLAAVLVAVAVGGVFLAKLPDLRAGERARAEREYENALAGGLLARTMQDRASAFTRLGRALELFPDRGEAIAMWCLCVRNFDGAEAALVELDRRVPSTTPDPDLQWIRVLLLRRCGRVAESEQLERSLGTPRTSTALWLAGALRLDDGDAGDQARALALMSLGCRTAPGPRLLLLLQWAACARIAGDTIALRESAETLQRLWPDNPVALHYAAANLGHLEPARAAELQRAALDLGLDDPNGLRNLAAYLLAAGRHPDWIAPMQQHLALHPDDDLRGKFLGTLTDRGEERQATAIAEAWLREAPDHPLALRHAGRLAALRNDLDDALPLLRRVVALRPDDPEAHYDLAVASDGADQDESLRCLARVIELDPVHTRAHRRLLDTLDELGDHDGMRAELERWLQHREDDLDAWRQLARLLTDRGDRTELPSALRALQRAELLAGGRDASLLQAQAEVLDALDCGPAATACRDRARALAARAQPSGSTREGSGR